MEVAEHSNSYHNGSQNGIDASSGRWIIMNRDGNKRFTWWWNQLVEHKAFFLPGRWLCLQMVEMEAGMVIQMKVEVNHFINGGTGGFGEPTTNLLVDLEEVEQVSMGIIVLVVVAVADTLEVEPALTILAMVAVAVPIIQEQISSILPGRMPGMEK